MKFKKITLLILPFTFLMALSLSSCDFLNNGKDDNIATTTEVKNNPEDCKHTFTEPTYKWASDYSKVLASRKCSICNQVEKELVTDITSTKEESTCSKEGKIVYISGDFKNPAFDFQEVEIKLAKKEHTPVTIVDTVYSESTCQTNGEQQIKTICEVCGEEISTYKETTPLVEHNYSSEDYEIIKNPTELNPGQVKIYCKYGCGNSQVYELPQIPTVEVNYPQMNEAQTSTYCQENNSTKYLMTTSYYKFVGDKKGYNNQFLSDTNYLKTIQNDSFDAIEALTSSPSGDNIVYRQLPLSNDVIDNRNFSRDWYDNPQITYTLPNGERIVNDILKTQNKKIDLTNDISAFSYFDIESKGYRGIGITYTFNINGQNIEYNKQYSELDPHSVKYVQTKAATSEDLTETYEGVCSICNEKIVIQTNNRLITKYNFASLTGNYYSNLDTTSAYSPEFEEQVEDFSKYITNFSLVKIKNDNEILLNILPSNYSFNSASTQTTYYFDNFIPKTSSFYQDNNIAFGRDYTYREYSDEYCCQIIATDINGDNCEKYLTLSELQNNIIEFEELSDIKEIHFYFIIVERKEMEQPILNYYNLTYSIKF